MSGRRAPSAAPVLAAPGVAAVPGVAATLLALLALCGALAGAPRAQAVTLTDVERARLLQLSPLPPPPPDRTNAWADDPAAARLGQRLFFDARLSADGTVSCATCHPAERSFADGRQLAHGLADLTRHAPSLWNVAYHRWFFWDGRADSLWAQALAPLEDPREHGLTRAGVVRLLRDDDLYRAEYETVFGPLPEVPDALPGTTVDAPRAPGEFGPASAPGTADAPADVTRAFVNVGKALAAYQRRLVSRHAPFDTWIEGLRDGDPEKLAAIGPAAQRGAQLFVGRANCRLCHSGPEFTDREFHGTRAVPLRDDLRKDPGRLRGLSLVDESPFNGRSPWSDDPEAGADKLAYLRRTTDTLGQFKTPTLRNVALSAPYLHQGQMPTLRDVLRHYSTFERTYDPNPGHFERMLVPLHLTEQELDDLVAFLESLTDTGVDPGLLRPPDDGATH